MQIGFIGAGLMGYGIALNLIRSGHLLRVIANRKRDNIEKLVSQVPLGRLSVPEDIGNLAAFLCSDLGGFICGQSILVDGGRTFWKKS